MNLQLDQETFRNLVKLHLFTMAASLGASAIELTQTRFQAFSSEFDTLNRSYFGTLSDDWIFPLAAVVIISLSWSVASTIFLLSFRRWARWGLWASTLTFLPILFLPEFSVSYSTAWADIAAIIDGGLFGAILLLAYSKDHGGIWFAKRKP